MAIKEITARTAFEEVGIIIKESFTVIDKGWLALVDVAGTQKLVAIYEEDSMVANVWKADDIIDKEDAKLAIMSLNPHNAAFVRRVVKWSNPSACGNKGVSVGFSDWLGISDTGLVNFFAKKQIKPVLVEYTTEDSLAIKRNFLEAVDTATWSVLAAGYKEGYGANAAGLKTEDDIVKALLYGYSMIGLDCSEKINLEIEKMSDEAVEKRFAEFPMEFQAAMRASYLNVEFKVGEEIIKFTQSQLERAVLEYGEAIMYAQSIYNAYLKTTPWNIDFELNISKKGKCLTVQEHYLIANEFQRNGINLTTMCLDAIEEKEGLAVDFKAHAAIADTYNYRLSIKNADVTIHDLGAVTKILGSKGHFKLNNLLWLAVLKTLAEVDASLFEKVAAKASLETAKAEDLAFETETGRKYALSYRAILEDIDPVLYPIKETILENKEAYSKNVEDLVVKFLKTF